MIRTTCIALVFVLVGCGHKNKPKTTRKAGAILAALFTAADAEKTPYRCASLETPALPDEDLGHGWTAHGHSIARSDGNITLGVIADAGGDAPKTIAALGRLRAQLDAAKPDLVLALGGMGSDAAQIAATLGTVSDHADWVVVALPGDLESAAAQTEAIATLRKRGDHVLDGRLVRWIETGSPGAATGAGAGAATGAGGGAVTGAGGGAMTGAGGGATTSADRGAAGAASGGATFGIIPGASARERLVAGAEGCGWTADDVAKVVGELTRRNGLRVLVTAEAPREITGGKHGQSAGTLAGEPTGELALVAPQPVDLAIHGPGGAVGAASSAATGHRDGAKTGLTPGTADATTRLPDAHAASAGVLLIRGDTWSWKPLIDSSSP